MLKGTVASSVSMKQIKCLTSLRFFAAAKIVVFHSVNAFRGLGQGKIPFPLGQGVSFFFVLSGFILTYVYPSLSGSHRIRDFYVARIARIWPAHFVTFLLLLWLIPFGLAGLERDMGGCSGKPFTRPRLDSISHLLFFFQQRFVEHLNRGLFLPRFPVSDLSI